MVCIEYVVKNVCVWVRREIEVVELEKDVNGMVLIEVVFIRKENSYVSIKIDCVIWEKKIFYEGLDGV